ncbi:hypothetical protein FE784_04360 [Paenibacillus hemerocallicola]|uniref:Uncharacterized protein n=1 Tax=Paenibacillus hemerocallicola TaxID=1172614 RepID=A0A5C4TF22_9BACL|nr:hypothetical protein FE784_04360 [Paenibacillus hemerocallicola]
MDMVGNCCICHTAIYCKGGFLDGVVERHSLYCHSCYESVDDTRERESGSESAGGSADSGGAARAVSPLRNRSGHKNSADGSDPT